MMSNLSRPALLLLKLDLLRAYRNGVLAKVVGKKWFSPKRAITLKVGTPLLFISVACLLPMLTPGGLSATDFGQDLARAQHLIISVVSVFLFYMGMFVGANLIYELTLSENEQLLAYPIVMADLVQYRVMDILLVALNACLFFFIPIMIFVFFALGWSITWVVAMVLLATIILMAVFLMGLNGLLLAGRLMPHRGSDKIFIGIFLMSIAFLIIAAQLFKSGNFDSGDMALWAWLNQQLSLFSFSFMMDRTVSRAWGLGQYLLSLAAGSMLLFFMANMCLRSLGRAYHRLHVQSNDMTAQPKQDVIRLGFGRLNSYLLYLPLGLRALLIKDTLALVRGPNLLFRIFGFLVFLSLVAIWRQSFLADPFLFVVYFSTTFIISRLFIDTVGQERNNIFLIKQLYPSASRYLLDRAKMTFGISLFLLLPIWGLLIGAKADISWFELVWRLPLLSLTVVMTSILVTLYSAAFAEFSKDHIEKYKFGIHPVAMLFLWSFSGLAAMFFYKLDLALVNAGGDSMAMILIVIMGLVLVVSVAVFGFLGVRRIERYV